MGSSKEAEKIIIRTVNKACEKYSDALEVFKPQAGQGSKREEEYGENGFPERNLSCYFAQTFLKDNGGYAFFEVPFKLNGEGNYNHIDAYVVNDQIGILIETKRLYTIEKFRNVAGDASRLSCKELKETIKKNDKERNVPHYALILAEVWGEDFKVWWKNDSKNLETEWKKKWGDKDNGSLSKFERWNEEYKKDDDEVFKSLKEFKYFGASKDPYHTYDGREKNKGVYCLYAYRRRW